MILFLFEIKRYFTQGVCDGAGALVLASEEAVKSEGLTPLARIVGYSVVGVEPSIMGIGPAPAIKNLLKTTGKSLNDIEIIEVIFSNNFTAKSNILILIITFIYLL